MTSASAASLEGYLKYLVENDRIPAAKTYGALLRKFDVWLAGRGRSLVDYLPVDAEVYKRQLGAHNANTANTFLAAIQGYQKWRVGSLSLTSDLIVPETQRSNQLKLIRRERNIRKYEKTALTPDEAQMLFRKMRKDRLDPVVYAGTVLHFYFGARASELGRNLADAAIDFDKREMILTTGKTRVPRYLAWHDTITPYMVVWYDEIPLKRPDYWLTRRIRQYRINGIPITSKFGRKSFETNERALEVPQMLIDAILGHTNNRIGDVYMDWTSLQSDIRDVMENKHYMLVHDVLG